MRVMIEYSGKGKILIKVLVLSFVFNVGLLLTLAYVSYIKTDFGYRVLSKTGLLDYNHVDYRHNIEYRCLEGWANSLYKQHIEADVVFYGNSITYESDFQKFFPKLQVVNLGCNRDDLDDLIHRSFVICRVRPRKIFVLGGINRLMDITIEEFRSKYDILVDTIKRQNPNAQLFLQSILPVNVEMELGERYVDSIDKLKQANLVIKEIAVRKQCTFVDLYSIYQVQGSLPRRYTRDGIHLCADAYSIWAQVIRKYLD